MQIAEQNRLLNEQRKVEATRVETMKLKTFASSSMMAQLAKALRNKVMSYMPPGTGIFKRKASAASSKRSFLRGSSIIGSFSPGTAREFTPSRKKTG